MRFYVHPRGDYEKIHETNYGNYGGTCSCQLRARD